MSAFDKALADFIAVARAELELKTSAKSIAYTFADGVRLLSPDDEDDADDTDALGHALEAAAYKMTDTEHAEA
jgi:hypothetical protein